MGAPLACEEAEDDWNDFTEHSCTDQASYEPPLSNLSESDASTIEDLSAMDCFLERGKSGSLEDLVKTFDKKLSECFRDYDDNISSIAPVQIRSQEDIINSCQ